MTGIVYSDLLIAFDANPEALERSNPCVISEQGKLPDFVLEVASRRARNRPDRRAGHLRRAGGIRLGYWSIVICGIG